MRTESRYLPAKRFFIQQLAVITIGFPIVHWVMASHGKGLPFSWGVGLLAIYYVVSPMWWAWMKDWQKIVITEDGIEGPSGAISDFGRRITTRLSDVDLDRSRQRPLLSRWHRHTDIHSKDGKRIRLSHHLLGNGQVLKIRNELGLERLAV